MVLCVFQFVGEFEDLAVSVNVERESLNLTDGFENQSFLVDHGRVICLQVQVESFRLECLYFHFGARLNKHFTGLAADLAGHRIFEAELRRVEISISYVGKC